jgi:L-2-hydroxycarboxylate dehydrogenase (NAD+)
MIFDYRELESFSQEVFISLGFGAEDATTASKVLVSSDMRGIMSHGMARLDGYVRLTEEGRINPKPNMQLIRDKGCNGTLDADKAVGLVSAQKAIKIAIDKCNKYGSGWVAVQNSNHFGIAAQHALQALPKNYIGFAMTNASPLVSVANGADRVLGTNPICVAIPTNHKFPFVLDMATSAVSNGKIEIADRAGKSLDGEWINDKNGLNSLNPKDMSLGGSLLPLGGKVNNSGYKGYGLGAWVDIFCGVLSGANYGQYVPPFVSYLQPLAHLPGKGIGHFVGVWDIDGFRDIEEFKNEMDAWIKHVKGTKAVEGKDILIPGEKEYYANEHSMKNGVFIEDSVFDKLKSMAKKFKINEPNAK